MTVTCHSIRDRRLGALVLGFLCAGTSLAAGCGDDSAAIELNLTAPAPGATLTMADDDQDSEHAGLQFDIVGASKGLHQGTTVDLYLDRDRQSHSPKVEDDGALHVPSITLPPGTHRIYFQTGTGSVSSDVKQAYTVRTLLITEPEDGGVLTMANDEDEQQPGLQISASVDGYALDSHEDIGLMLDGESVGSQPLDIMGQAIGQAVFRQLTPSTGTHTLLAYAGKGDDRIESDEIEFEVQAE